jgi:hypothetical protein
MTIEKPADLTSAWSEDGAGAAETIVVPPPTVAGAPALAWSVDEDETVPVERQSWGETWSAAAVLLSLGAAVAIVTAVLGWVAIHRDSDPQPLSPVSSTMDTAALPPAPSWSAAPAPQTPDPDVVSPPTTVTVQAAPPPPTTVTVEAAPTEPGLKPENPSRDDEFIERLEADQLVLHNRTEALSGARWVCRQLAAGRSQADIVASAERDNPTVTHLGMVDYVSTAAAFYCPEFSGS